jgi:ribosomal protein S18 acetylase RimI-like enzyme
VSELSTLCLARANDAREIAEMSRDMVEQGLAWSWTPARVQHFITGSESSVVIARRDRNGLHARDRSPNGIRPFIDDRYGASRQGIDAFAIMQFGDETAHLNLIAVAPEHRRQGLGRLLMEWLTATAIEAGIFRIDLELRVQNHAARVFYERLGFDSLGTVEGYYQGSEAALRMTRRFAKNVDSDVP